MPGIFMIFSRILTLLLSEGSIHWVGTRFPAVLDVIVCGRRVIIYF